MTEFPLRPLALAAGCLLLAGCASGGGGTTTAPPPPAPQPGEPAPPPAPTGGRGPAVGVGPARALPYRIERHDSLTLQYEGGASQEQVRDRTAFVRLTLLEGPEPGSYAVTVVLDSVLALENGTPVPADSTLLVRGTQWTSTLTPAGGLGPLQASRSSTLGDEIARSIRLLFPRLPQAGVREGMEWTDSTTYEVVADAFPGNETAVTAYRATEAERSGGDKAIALESNGTYTRSGTRVQGEQQLEMTASGTRRVSHRLSLEGVLVSAQGSDAGEMTISVPALGQTVPVKQSGSFSITSAVAGSR